MTNVIAFPGVVRHRRGHLKATRDFLVIREDGSLGFAPKTIKRPEVDLDDLRAGMQMARQAAERDD